MQFANRLESLQSNVFADMDRAKARAKAAGQQIIDLSMGSADLPVEDHIIEAIAQSLSDPATHRYVLFHATQAFREAVASWYQQRFGVSVNPETEVLPLIGCQEGTAHLPLALLNPGDYALLLDPGYPSHAGGVYLASGLIYPMPLRAENQFLPVFADIPDNIREKARMMVLSYPHNPTTATATLDFFQEAVEFCQQHNIALVHDFPYLDIVFPKPHQTAAELAPSILQADRDKTTSIEFFTLSKSYHMGGFRIGYAIGNAQLIKALRQVKATVDFNQYLGILNGAIAALSGPQVGINKSVEIFRQRRDGFIQSLHRHGYHEVSVPPATMYVWLQLPPQWRDKSIEFCTNLVEKTGIAASPGIGFGKSGEGYIRFALVQPVSVLEEVAQHLSEFL